jgi:predicted ATPase
VRPDLPSGTVTFLFTDVEASTRLLHSLGAEGYADALAEHRLVIREACSAQKGVEVDTQGDAFFFAFPTAPGALTAASAMTEALASGPIRVRVGLHTGMPLLTDEGYVGNDVHFAARVAASGHGGQVVLSKSTADLVGLSLTDLGEHRLKDIAEAVTIYQLGDGSFPPLKTISNTNLPRPASSFVGREAELAQVLSRIEDGARLVTLLGPGGSGKTRLAIEAASTLVPKYKAGVFWVGLVSLRDPALVSETISQTLGAKDGLAEHIGERELLLLLDNLEQVIEAAPELSSLLATCPNLTLLVTSRELLRVQGEVEYPVPPLAEPEAVSLFCERSQLEPSEEITELCAHLDNLPLAVELAAARTKALSVVQILERLSSRLDLLKGGRDADPRQQTLRATIEWSYELLSSAEQQLFARLSVFAGGCTLEAAEEVADADLDTLQSLVEKSLVRCSDERYWMLETIREHAAQKVTNAPDRDDVRRRHAEWFVKIAERVPEDVQEGRGEVTATVEIEHDNVRAALSWLLDAGEETRAAAAIWPLSFFWIRQGHVREGYTWAQRIFDPADDLTPDRVWGAMGAGELARFAGDVEAAMRFKEATMVVLRQLGEERWIAATLSDLSDLAGAEGDLDRARALSEEALTLRMTLGDLHGVAHARLGLALVEFRSGDFAKARKLYAESRSSWPRDSSNAAKCELMIAECCRRLGEIEAAQQGFRGSMQVLAEAEPALVPELLQEVGALALIDEKPVPAARLLAASDSLWNEIGMVRWDTDDYERNVAALRMVLGDEGFAAEWCVGSSMSSDEALLLARVTLD